MFDADLNMIVPISSNGDEVPTKLALKRLYAVTSRIQEVATVNAHKAPELLATFNRAYCDLGEYLSMLELCWHHADRKARDIRSRIILDDVPRILAEKGLASARNPGGSADQREAILDGSAEYQKALERVQVIKCMSTFLKDKRDSLEMAFTSVKKILGNESPSFSNQRDSRLSHRELPANVTAGHSYNND